MARPLKNGVDYWPFDVGLFRDKKFKLLKAEFGLKGVIIALELLNAVYESAGYFKKWDDDDCFLMSDSIGGGCTSENIREVLRGCLRRSLFDQRVFEMSGVLTSQGIQRRYLRMVGNNRDEIRIIREYWLLNADDKNDVPASVLEKLTFFSVSDAENAVKRRENNVKSTGNAQRKEKESKENKSKEKERAASAHAPFKKPTLEEVAGYCVRKNLQMEPEAFYDYYETNGWTVRGGAPIRDWHACARGWARRDKQFTSERRTFHKQNVCAQTGESSLDKSDLDDLIRRQLMEDGPSAT